MTFSELKSQVAALEPQEQRELKTFLEELEADAWDAQIEADAKAGKLDHLIEKARTEIRAGLSQPINGDLRAAYERYKNSVSGK